LKSYFDLSLKKSLSSESWKSLSYFYWKNLKSSKKKSYLKSSCWKNLTSYSCWMSYLMSYSGYLNLKSSGYLKKSYSCLSLKSYSYKSLKSYSCLSLKSYSCLTNLNWTSWMSYLRSFGKKKSLTKKNLNSYKNLKMNYSYKNLTRSVKSCFLGFYYLKSYLRSLSFGSYLTNSGTSWMSLNFCKKNYSMRSSGTNLSYWTSSLKNCLNVKSLSYFLSLKKNSWMRRSDSYSKSLKNYS